MRTVLVSLSLLAIVGCSAPSEEPATPAKPRAPAVEVVADDELASAPDEGPPTVRREPGRLLATDAIALGRAPKASAPAPGLSAPEVGGGEYANPDWRLPDDGNATPTEGLPPGADAVPLTPRSRAEELAQEARMVEDLPAPPQEHAHTRMVEELPVLEDE